MKTTKRKRKRNQLIFENDHLKKLLFFEYIDRSQYDEFTCDLYYDKSSVLKCVIPRRRIQVRAGEVMKARTERNELVGFFKTKLLKNPKTN